MFAPLGITIFHQLDPKTHWVFRKRGTAKFPCLIKTVFCKSDIQEVSDKLMLISKRVSKTQHKRSLTKHGHDKFKIPFLHKSLLFTKELKNKSSQSYHIPLPSQNAIKLLLAGLGRTRRQPFS